MQLKDCIHFYLGCRCRIESIANRHGQHLVDSGFYGSVGDIIVLDRFRLNLLKDGDNGVYEVKPILRRLESMTGEECDKYNRISDSLFSLAEGVNQVRQASAAISYLINLGFDLFGLIESGEAIDQETLKKEP